MLFLPMTETIQVCFNCTWFKGMYGTISLFSFVWVPMKQKKNKFFIRYYAFVVYFFVTIFSILVAIMWYNSNIVSTSHVGYCLPSSFAQSGGWWRWWALPGKISDGSMD
jgi:hypothetical protein